MKIGILTFHYSINPGSVMQAYCVYSLLKKALPGANVEIINLIPSNREKISRNFFSSKPPFIRANKLIKYYSIRNFINKNTPLSKLCTKADLNEQIDFINGLEYDYIFTGSDTVWMYSDKLSKKLPNIYFLPTSIKSQKVSIAASVDPLTHPVEYLKRKEVLLPTFNQYKSILVRDKVTEDLLKEIGVHQPHKIADPTLLYDFEKDFNIKTNKTPDIKKKVVLIGVTDKKIAGWIKKLLKKHSKVYTFLDRKRIKILRKNKKNGLHIFEDHVLDQLNLYSKIDIIITDRFHGSIFSMKLSNSLVINVERFNKNPLPNSKGRDLFTSIGIPEYCLRLDQNNQPEFKKKLLGLIDQWDSQRFLNRENLLREFISQNQMEWKNHVEQTITDQDNVLPF